MNSIINSPSLVLAPVALRPTIISSSGVYFPKDIVRSEDLMLELKSEANFGISHRWMNDIIGIDERRFSCESDTAVTLALKAATNALSSSNIGHREIHKVIYCGIEKDRIEPSAAHLIANELDISPLEAHDISDACFGFMRGIEDGIRAINCVDQIKNVLIVTGEAPSKNVKKVLSLMKHSLSSTEVKKWLGFLTAGDAGGAIILSEGDLGATNGFKPWCTRNDNSLHNKCYYKQHEDGKLSGQMLMGHLTAKGKTLYKSIVDEVLSNPFHQPDDRIIFHGTGKGSMRVLLECSDVPESKWVKLFHKIGNVASASFPAGYDALVNSVNPQSGENIGCFFNGSGLTCGYRQYTF